MGKIIFSLGIILVLMLPVRAQNHEVSVGMGLGSSIQVLDRFLEFGSLVSSAFFKTSSLEKARSRGEFRLEYAYTPHKRWSFGSSFSFSQSEFDVVQNNRRHGEQLNNYYTLATETKFSFLKKEQIRLYALVGVGATFGHVKRTFYSEDVTETSDFSIFNFQITPIGIRYGKRWGGFAEVGFGYRGLLGFGAFYVF